MKAGHVGTILTGYFTVHTASSPATV